MEFMVIGADGSEYGPATVDILKQWVQENRLTETTILKNFQTGQSLPASAVPGLFLNPVSPAPGQPMHPVRPPVPAGNSFANPPSNYQRPQYGYGMPANVDGGGADVAWAIIRAIAAVVFFFAFRGIGLIFAVYGVVYGYRAYQKGHKMGGLALGISVLALAAVLAGWALRLTAHAV